MDRGPGVASNSPLLVADPTEPRFVVLANRLDAPDFSCALQVSGDSGRTFAPANPVPTLPAGAEKCYAPEVAFDRTGTLFYLFVGLAGGGNEPTGVFLTTSADRGRTFTAPHQVLEALNFAARMVIDRDVGRQGRLYLAWLHATSDPPLGGFGPTPNPLLSAYSDDGGATFSAPVQVNDTERVHAVAPALTIGADHAVHVAYYDLGDDVRDYHALEGPTWEGTWSLVVATSRDRGAHFARGVVVDDGLVASSRILLVFTMPPPSLVASGHRACVAWTDARYGDDDALLRCSDDGGRRWGPLHRLNDDPRGNGASQYLPRLALAPDGRIDAVFYDRDVDRANIGAVVSYTYSRDGRRFAPTVALARDAFSTRVGQRYEGVSAEGLVEFGSRLGLLARPTGVVAAWTDTRNSLDNGTGQDIFTTDVRLAFYNANPGWARILGAGMVLAALAGLILAVRRRRLVVAAP